MADVSVRPAVVDDAAEIARIQVETWRTAYREILPAAVLEGLTPELVATEWAQAVGNPPSSRHRVLVATEGEWRVGFAVSTPAEDLQPDDPDPERTTALGLMLVEPRWGRRGHGSRLLAAVTDLAWNDGMTRAIVWIPEADEVTRDFLVSTGWAPDGLVRAMDTGAGELREIRLHTEFGDHS